MDELDARYQELETKILAYHPELNRERLHSAYLYARTKHEGQLRKDGSPFVTHPIAAADICADLRLDEDSVVACLLHDTIEDTDATHEELAKLFGETVASIVEGVTKLTRVVYTSKEEEQMENLRKMLMAMAKDIRVILIKIADRLHNMQTMNFQSEAKRREKALETMEIYAPIAHRLGMQRMKWQLEDLSLIYLDPIGYQEIEAHLENKMKELNPFMEKIRGEIVKRMEENGIRCEVSCRIKHIYSIYRKMYNQNKQFDEVLDLCAFRVIVDNLSDCYNALGQIHDMYNPMPGRFKDYIATPKPNLYQSLHTTVIGTDGQPFEVQIRTVDMHLTAEYGVAAHWKYKDGVSGPAAEEKYAWIRGLLETQQNSEAHEFVHGLKIDMFADEVFVFTPQGDVINLPAGATPIDFAYGIHSQVGNHMTGAKVNGRIVPFDRKLENGDIVEVTTSPNAKGPGRDWMNIVKSSAAKTKIRQWFKKEKREENILRGRVSIENELKHQNIDPDVLEDGETMETVLHKLAVTTIDDMLAAVGYGGMTAIRCVNRIKEEITRSHKADKLQQTVEKLTQQPATVHKAEPKGIKVCDLDNCLVKFSHCCTPVPGDEVQGFITRGCGISVHRKDCINCRKAKKNEEQRWVNVTWGDTTGSFYQADITVTADARNNLIIDIATVLNSVKVTITSMNIRETGDGGAVAFISVKVRDTEELNTAIRKVRGIRSVRDVVRPGVEVPEEKEKKV